MQEQLFSEYIVAARPALATGLYAVTRPVPRIAVQTAHDECHVVGLPVGPQAGLVDRTGAVYREGIDAALRRDVGINPDGAAFDAGAVAEAWLAPTDTEWVAAVPGGCSRVRVDAHAALYADPYTALVVPHALPLDAGAVLALRPKDAALWALAVRFMRQRGDAVVGRLWQTRSADNTSCWTLRAGVERPGDPAAPYAALVAYSAPADVVGDVRARALQANTDRAVASCVVTRAAFGRLFAGPGMRRLAIGASSYATTTTARGVTRVRASARVGAAVVGLDGAQMRDAIGAVAGERLKLTVADTRTPVVVCDADAAQPPVYALVLPAVDCDEYLAPVPPRVV